MQFTFFLTLISALSSVIDSTKYCDINPKHILCGKQDYAKECGDTKYIVSKKLSESAKREILELHNSYRNKVAAGKVEVDGGILPTASNMEEMEWDDELASLSETYVKNCNWTHSCLTCGKLDRFIAGENLFLMTQPFGNDPQNLFTEYPWKRVLHGWTDLETHFFPVKDVAKYKSPAQNGIDGEGYRHLTQTIWATSKLVGCGRIVYKSEKTQYWEIFSSCHYGPGGNILGDPLYKQGVPCSNCEGGRGCSAAYHQLCSSGLEKNLTEEQIPQDFNSSNVLHSQFLFVLVSVSAAFVRNLVI